MGGATAKACADEGAGATEFANGCLDASGIAGSQSANVRETLSLTVSYRGAAFSGFARQPGQLTVQGSLEEALALVFRRPVETTCAGRTDAGVHALGQVVSFDMVQTDAEDRTDARLMRSLNALTHDDIAVRGIAHHAPGFSARFDAKAREYRYHLAVGAAPPVLMRDFSWHVGDALDVGAMERASRCLIGEHDFKSFCMASSAVGKPTCRFVSEVSFSRQEIMGEPFVVVKVVGNAFLHSMVRTMVGTLVAVGKGRRDPSWVADVLAACDRRAAGENAPAEGLVFWRVIY